LYAVEKHPTVERVDVDPRDVREGSRVTQRRVVHRPSESYEAGAEVQEAVAVEPLRDDVAGGPQIPSAGIIDELREDAVEGDDLLRGELHQALAEALCRFDPCGSSLGVRRLDDLPEGVLVHRGPELRRFVPHGQPISARGR